MEQRPLGKTGLSVSALGFGCGAVGGLMVRGDHIEQTAAVASALDAGITYFDTAPSYGDGRSEENLGRVMRELGTWRDVVVGTKVRLRPSDLDHPAPAIARSLETSLRRLGRDAVDLFQLHNPIAESSEAAASVQGSGQAVALDAVCGPIVDGMRLLVSRGLTRHIGITGLGQTRAVHATAVSGKFDTAQTYFNALNPSGAHSGAAGGEQDFAALIGAAASAGLGVIAIRVMAAGALSAQQGRHTNAGDPGPQLAAGAEYGRDLERAAAIRGLAADLGYDGPLELALRFALATPGISTVLVGYSDRTHLEDALRWTARGPAPADVVNRVVAVARAS
ncbi:MAG TPA: aldo/keto reductase [bacterium]|nr:aldo/keto reductase [bacterium]